AVPTPFTGTAGDNTGGIGLNANSTKFTLRRDSDNFYWNGSGFQSNVANLATTHSATTGDTTVTWTDNVTLPTWTSLNPDTYTVRVTVTDKAGATFSGPAAQFTVLNPYSPVVIGTNSDTSSGSTLESPAANVLVGNTIFVTI